MTILTRLGHSRDNYIRLLDELRVLPLKFVAILNNGQTPVDGVACVEYEGEYHGAATLNKGLPLVDTSWLFVLDSDEWYTSMQMQAVLDVVARIDEDVDCLVLPRRNFDVGQGSSWHCWPDYQRRVLRRTPQLQWRRAPHEFPVVSKEVRLTGTSWAIVHDHFNADDRARMAKYFARTDLPEI